MSVRSVVGVGVMGIACIAMMIAGLIIHAWTVVITFFLHGIIGAAIALLMPVLAEMYILYRIYQASVSLLNPYIFSIGVYLALWVLIFIGASILGSE